MTPHFAADNVADRGLRYVKLADLIVGQLRHVVLLAMANQFRVLAPGMSVAYRWSQSGGVACSSRDALGMSFREMPLAGCHSPLRDGIAAIVSRRPEEEVIRQHARGNIAAMKNLHPGRNGAEMHLPGNPKPEPPPSTEIPGTLTAEEWAAYQQLARAIAGGPARGPERETKEISLDGGQTWRPARRKIDLGRGR
jgi:hypothetical protein